MLTGTHKTTLTERDPCHLSGGIYKTNTNCVDVCLIDIAMAIHVYDTYGQVTDRGLHSSEDSRYAGHHLSLYSSSLPPRPYLP